jgi:pimeloyl-ACP methyl ester carboxylesterase
MLILTGENDTIIPMSGVLALAERYPSVEVHVLPDTKHPQGIETHPDIHADSVLGFLDRTLKQ